MKKNAHTTLPYKEKTTAPFPAPPALPTQWGSEGIRYDFNEGARVYLPEGSWHVELHDADSGNLLFATDLTAGSVLSSKKFFVRFSIKVWKKGETTPVLDHTQDLTGKSMCVHFPSGTIGDVIAWFSYLERFQQQHQCKIAYTMAPELAALFKDNYPTLIHIDRNTRVRNLYASYRIGLFFNDVQCDQQPIDFRLTGLASTAAYILGVHDKSVTPPKLTLNAKRQIKEPYVCIAVQASTQCKKWNHPTGWQEVITFLKEQGYRVLCIDKDTVHGQAPAWTHCPAEAENFTGDVPLSERIALLQHASAFIGVSSGLAWLAWACKIPVVMISGFTLPWNEFETPYRVFNVHTCNGCWNDIRHQFNHQDFFWCPRHQGTPRQFECSSLITPTPIINNIKHILKKTNQ